MDSTSPHTVLIPGTLVSTAPHAHLGRQTPRRAKQVRVRFQVTLKAISAHWWTQAPAAEAPDQIVSSAAAIHWYLAASLKRKRASRKRKGKRIRHPGRVARGPVPHAHTRKSMPRSSPPLSLRHVSAACSFGHHRAQRVESKQRQLCTALQSILYSASAAAVQPQAHSHLRGPPQTLHSHPFDLLFPTMAASLSGNRCRCQRPHDGGPSSR